MRGCKVILLLPLRNTLVLVADLQLGAVLLLQHILQLRLHNPALINISVLPAVIFRYVREGRFRIEERTLTAFQWLYSPHQHRIVSRADLGSPSR